MTACNPLQQANNVTDAETMLCGGAVVVAVGGPWGLSLRAVLDKKKRLGFLWTPLLV